MWLLNLSADVEFPALNTLDVLDHNLPVRPTSPIGREADLARLYDRLRRPNVGLVTLTGAGGVGKTRLALSVAAELLDGFPVGVCFVSSDMQEWVGRVLIYAGCRHPQSDVAVGCGRARSDLVARTTSA